jgi:hypothetical protein
MVQSDIMGQLVLAVLGQKGKVYCGIPTSRHKAMAYRGRGNVEESSGQMTGKLTK